MADLRREDVRIVRAHRVPTVAEMRDAMGLGPEQHLPFAGLPGAYQFSMDWVRGEGWVGQPVIRPMDPWHASVASLRDHYGRESQLALIRFLQEHTGFMQHLEPEKILREVHAELLDIIANLIDAGDVKSALQVFKHYAVGVFEGQEHKVAADGSGIMMHRHELNFGRMNLGLDHLGGPQVPWWLWRISSCMLLEQMLEDGQVPMGEGDGLYDRAHCVAIEPSLGVKSGDRWRFTRVICGSGPYFGGGASGIKVYLEADGFRVAGPTGRFKLLGHYCDVKLAAWAVELGLKQRVWLAAADQGLPVLDRRIEEVGTSNWGAFVIADGNHHDLPKDTVYFATPSEARGTILPSTRKRAGIHVLKHERKMPIVECEFTANDLVRCHREGRLLEMNTHGTAAGFCPVLELWHEGEMLICMENEPTITRAVDQRLREIQVGIGTPDGWLQVGARI